MKYRVITAESAASLETKITTLIDYGWIPQGGLSITKVPSRSGWYIEFAQALIHKGD